MTPIQQYNGILLLAVIALAMANLLLTGDSPQPLTARSLEQVKTIAIHSGSDTLHFTKTGSNWALDQDSRLVVDQEKIHQLLPLLNTHSFRQFETTAQNLAAFELADSTRHIDFDNTRITFGTLDPVNRNRYILIGNSIHLVNDYYYQFLLAKQAFFSITPD